MFAYGVLTGALSVLGAIALAMTLYWLFSRWRAQRLKRKYNHTVSPKAQLSLSRWSKDKMARTITGFSRRRKLALAPVPAYEAPDFGPVTMPSLAAEEEQPPPTPPSSHWPKQGKAPRGIEDSKFDLRAALTTNGPVRCFDVDAVRRKPPGGGSGGDSAPGGGGSSPPAAGGRKLCAKSKPFWELQQEKEAKRKPAAPAPPAPPPPPDGGGRDASGRRAFYSTRAGRTALRVCAECYATELQYAHDLHLALRVFRDPLEPTLVGEERVGLFSNLQELGHLSGELLTELQRRGMDPLETLARAFGRIAPFFMLYTTYCANYDRALRELSRLKREVSGLPAWLRGQSHLAECRGLTLESYLIKPIQRLTKYHLFFDSLLKVHGHVHPLTCMPCTCACTTSSSTRCSR